MKIVVLDGYTLNPGDLTWSSLDQFGEVEIYDRTPTRRILDRAADAEIIFTNKTKLTSEILVKLDKLKYIGVLATGYDVVDISSAKEKNIIVTNVPAYGADSVAQMVFAHILHIINNVAGHAHDVRQGGWAAKEDFCYLISPQMELTGKVLGIIGYGDIGKATAKLGLAFNMKIMIHTRTLPESLPENTIHCDLQTLLAASDVISLHCPLTEATREMINSASIEKMKHDAILINCSRGPLVNEKELAYALEKNRIRAAGLDVLSVEPPADNPLITARNCYITPHIAWATQEARKRLLDIAVSNLGSYLEGIPINTVS